MYLENAAQFEVFVQLIEDFKYICILFMNDGKRMNKSNEIELQQCYSLCTFFNLGVDSSLGGDLGTFKDAIWLAPDRIASGLFHCVWKIISLSWLENIWGTSWSWR